MLVLYRADRQIDALTLYQDGRRLLAHELGLEPGPALQVLQRRILQHDRVLEPPSPGERMPVRRRAGRDGVGLATNQVSERQIRQHTSKLIAVLLREFGGPRLWAAIPAPPGRVASWGHRTDR